MGTPDGFLHHAADAGARRCTTPQKPPGLTDPPVLARLKRQIKIGAEERGAAFRHEFFDRVAFGPETLGAEVARQARFVCGPVRLMPMSA
jgi:hypothetical protein